MILDLRQGWKILQDVHDSGEKLGIFKPEFEADMGNQISEWENLPELKQLQLIYADKPYFGRELRYFNDAPWWYRYEIDVPENAGTAAFLRFTNVDYYCKVFLNGRLIGEHEGYSMPFSFRVDKCLNPGQKNLLIVKVWSPWDTEVDSGMEDHRTTMVSRNNIKGTYEHSDTFIQRDANPVGIYGSVTLELADSACFTEKPDMDYTLNEALTKAHVTAKASVAAVCREGLSLRFTCRDHLTRELIAEGTQAVTESGNYEVSLDAENIRLWYTWDKGGTWLYDLTLELLKDGTVLTADTQTVGFRKIEMVRDAEKTRFYLNGKAFYVRGTSYFPDLYVSNMCRERYKRDILNIKAAGYNLIRVHVHVDLPDFYELCTEIGIGIMQDSEYNWMHPVTDEFADRFIRVYLDTVRMLKRHTSLFLWILMNEPGLHDPMGTEFGRAMTINPGPRLYAAISEMDPSRPAIKGSFCENDLTSGDSHNYTGSLNGSDGHYSDIYGTTEKYNTEYGFDAPPCEFSLKQCQPAWKRLEKISDRFAEIGEYQYKLLKYFTEHYRMQKYTPNSGYVQFLFNDMCPQSFYGVYDWWGLPKHGLDAMLESNMPVGIFLKYSRDHIDGVYAVNDDWEALGDVQATVIFTNPEGRTVLKKTVDFCLGADTKKEVFAERIEREAYPHLNCALLLTQNGRVIASNHYEDLFVMPEHVKGHPERMSHEIGMRIYFCE